ncbi:MAG: RluA family pseudouridine synthase [Candidatus Omnitrophica bacterium]|nr:RluA family pseudouridine synthase [Candidatus Omnitrophota bacterium]
MPPSITRCPVLYEDEALLIIDKPEGVLSHPNPGGRKTACAFEGDYSLEDRRFDAPGGRIWLIHRLDQDTSGILLAAKDPDSAKACRDAFERGEVEKNYIALVSRKPMPSRGSWRDALTEQRRGTGVRTAIGHAKKPNALLHYTLKEHFPQLNLALLEIHLVTGRTHQIRVQASHRGHPVAGDRLYGHFGLNKSLRRSLELRRLFLHAWRLKIAHPARSRSLEICAPLPEDLERALGKAH